jgi:hypothetical protein
MKFDRLRPQTRRRATEYQVSEAPPPAASGVLNLDMVPGLEAQENYGKRGNSARLVDYLQGKNTLVERVDLLFRSPIG